MEGLRVGEGQLLNQLSRTQAAQLEPHLALLAVEGNVLEGLGQHRGSLGHKLHHLEALIGGIGIGALQDAFH
ncbi:hypothetical protein Mgrana_02280 [Meiothermus granaticius NBRC 107808]|uniref:Uncharacterized protein n=1 Tax=Meiothermus granaticius NBRC 107808 TaxID=1227551 RepID=A0A399F5B0_9DEIN|nr:hypothetical protein Mgrana_02280 [Meiothermus granaticius NBRC 107808]